MAGLWNGPYSNLESCLMRMEIDRKESLHSRLIETRRWIDVQDTLGFWGVEPGATGLEEQGPTTRTDEECFRSTMLDLGEGLPCLGYSGMRSLEK